jgi:ABC-2 type transport system permease protein
MFLMVLLREMRDIATSFTYASALIALTALVPLAASIQAQHYNRLLGDFAARQSIHQGDSASGSQIITRPVPPLLPFINGVYDSLSDEFTIQSDPASLNPSSEDIAPLRRLFPRIDLNLIIGVLMTLVAILLAHRAISGEKETGTLKLLLSTPISRSAIFFAKLSALILLLAAALAYSLALYAFVIQSFSNGAFQLTKDRLAQLAVISLISLLTLSVFAAIGMAISTTVRSSSVALASSMSVWVMAVIIWPSLGPYAAASLRPVPPSQNSRREIYVKESSLVDNELADHRAAAAALKAQNASVEQAWQQYIELKRRWMDRKRVEIGALNKEREILLARQSRLARQITQVSPYGAFRQTMEIMAGTGIDGYNAFHSAVEQYSDQELLPAQIDALALKKPWAGQTENKTDLQPPAFRLSDWTIGGQLKQAAFPIAFLLMEIALAIFISIRKFSRYDPR